MSPLWSLLRSVVLPRRRPRLVRRVTMHCPHGGEVVDVDLLTNRSGAPELVLRCSKHASRPPACDQSCRHEAEAVLMPAHAVALYPPGTGALEDWD